MEANSLLVFVLVGFRVVLSPGLGVSVGVLTSPATAQGVDMALVTCVVLAVQKLGSSGPQGLEDVYSLG